MITEEKQLNKEQKEAVEFKSGPLLIVAGAGTGKTTVVTERIKWLIGKGLAKPEEILALTFTEKAAREMEERVDQALPYGTFGLWISTFHSFCDRILRNEALHIGLNPHYRLLTEAETYLLVKNNFWKFALSYFRPTGNPYKFIEGMIQHFSRLKDEDVEVGEYLRFADQYQEIKDKKEERKKKEEIVKGQDENEERLKIHELASAYKIYEELKPAEGVMDFADLISNTLRLFRTRKTILARYQKQFKFILVDEFQDTNFAQNELVKLLVSDGNNITVVADDDQSIYRFRGAAISNVLQFRQDFPKTKVITLTQNYRSTQEILDRAYDLIQHNNPDRLEVQEKINKKLRGIREIRNIGEKIELIYTDRVEEEAEQTVGKIREIGEKDSREWKDFAILVRANNHSEPFVRALERARIPFQFLGPGMLFRQPEIKDLIAYLKVLYDFTDSVSLYRVLSMDIWGLSQRDLIWILNHGKKLNLSLFETLENLIKNDSSSAVGGISDKSAESLEKFMAMVCRHQDLVPKETAGQILYYFLEDSGILKNVVEYKSALEERHAQNITKFFDKLKSFESTSSDASIFAVVDYLNLAMDMGESPLASEIDWSENNAVNILTIHSAKGLEFPVVFLVNLVEGRFPTRERKEQIPIPDELIKEVLPQGDFHLEEERRLFYVGMTRAKERLIFSAANYYGEGKRERKLSPFVIESGVTPSLVTSHSQSQIPLFEWNKSTDMPVTNDESLMTKVDYLSYSAIETFKICPLHYKLRVILKIPTPMTSAQALGNSLHLTLRDLYHPDVKNRDWKTAVEILEKNWILEGYGSKKHRDDTLDKAKRYLKNYLESDLHKKANPIQLEQPFVLPLPPSAGESPLKIGGKIDRVDDLGNSEVEIIDYKTGEHIPKQKEIDESLQMTIYALAATDKGGLNIPVDKIHLSFYFFDNNTKITTVRTAEQLEQAKKDLFAIRDEIEHSDFACSGGLICEKCEFKMLCNS